MDKLKPCPFCGGKAMIMVDSNYDAFVECMECHAKSDYADDFVTPYPERYQTRKEKCAYVIAAWNRRASDDVRRSKDSNTSYP